MKNFSLLFIASLLLIGSTALAQSNNTKQQSEDKEPMEFEITDEMEKSEISAEKLPDEVHRDIKNNYHHAEILRAFRVKHEGAEDRGYLVLVKQGPKTWTIKFDSEGNALNKVNAGF